MTFLGESRSSLIAIMPSFYLFEGMGSFGHFRAGGRREMLLSNGCYNLMAFESPGMGGYVDGQAKGKS